MRGKLIGKDQYMKLLRMKQNEITKFLQETEYKGQIDELAVSYSGVDLIERALNKNLVATFEKLRRISEDKVDQLLDVYLQRWDLYDLKTVLRGIVSKADKEYIASLLISGGSLKKNFLMKLYETGDIEEVLKAIDFVPFAEWQDMIKKAKESGDLSEIDTKLSKQYYTGLLTFSKRLAGTGKPFGRFLQNEIDNLNFKTLLRLKKKGFEPAIIRNHMIFEGRILDSRLIEKLIAAEASTLKDVLRWTPYAGLLQETLTETELEVDKFLIQQSFLSVHQMPLTVTAILSYLLAKEIEVKNIKAIVKAKQLGIDERFIEQKLVI